MNTLEQELGKRLRWLKKCRVRIATTQDDHALEGITAKRLKSRGPRPMRWQRRQPQPIQ